MNSQYAILTQVSFRHEYFTDKIFNGISISPSGETAKALMNMGMVFKPLKDGFMLLYEYKNGPRYITREQVMAGEDLSFLITLVDDAFYNYTSLDRLNISKNIFKFSNEDEVYSDSGIHYLHPGPMVKSDYHSIMLAEKSDVRFFEKPFGVIKIKLEKNLETMYHIRFQAKKTYWKYILAASYLKELHKPYIINGDAQEIFTGPESIVLPDKTSALVFVSKEPIRLAQAYKKTFQLVTHYKSPEKPKVIKKTLPCPDINTISRISDPNSNLNFSEIFIY